MTELQQTILEKLKNSELFVNNESDLIQLACDIAKLVTDIQAATWNAAREFDLDNESPFHWSTLEDYNNRVEEKSKT